MCENIEITQRTSHASETTQIGIQNNYIGLSPEAACQMATSLFYNNFPKLEEQAMKVATSRVEELMETIAVKLTEKEVADMSALADPDAQYALYEAQKSYARFGTNNMLKTLSDLIVRRLERNDSEMCLKVAIDKAIEIAPLLSQEQLDYLSLSFLCKRVRFSDVKTIDDLCKYFVIWERAFYNYNAESFNYLQMLGCLQLYITRIETIMEKSYGFDKNTIKNKMPTIFDGVNTDYAPSNIGIILAISNAEIKTPHRFNPTIWIHE